MVGSIIETEILSDFKNFINESQDNKLTNTEDAIFIKLIILNVNGIN